MFDFSETVDYGEDLVGIQSDGTYVPPATSQPYNQPWDSGGGTPGNYSGVLDILKVGIGAWSQYQNNKTMVEYNRWEATQGGLFPVGRPSGMQTLNGAVQVRAAGNNTLIWLMLGVGAFILLRK